MNIFFLHFNQKECAKMHVDKHVVKMILESVQLLSSAHHLHPNKNFKAPYKLTHKNHPCSIWVRESLSNYLWLVELTKELCEEYTHRYGKKHKSEKYIEDLKKYNPDIPDIGFTVPRQAMPEVYKSNNNSLEDVIESYRQYYFFEKYNLLSWKKREIPDFILDFQQYE